MDILFTVLTMFGAHSIQFGLQNAIESRAVYDPESGTTTKHCIHNVNVT
jgi:hypothetical protein